jgi:hypothetical protein
MSDEIKEAIDVKVGLEPDIQSVSDAPDEDKNEKEIRNTESEGPLSD